jgi:hypothetical protein
MLSFRRSLQPRLSDVARHWAKRLSAVTRILWGAAIVGGLAVLSAGPASAHSAAGSPSSNYVTVLDAVKPADPGFRVSVIESGSRLQITWLSGAVLIVEGYESDPYLRIGPNGVEENRQSPATYINRTRQGLDTPPATINPDGPPEWVKVSSQPVARFHDHRIHYMGSVPPQNVLDDPTKRQEVQPAFAIAVHRGDMSVSPSVITGRVVWVPGPSPVASYIAAGVIASVLAMVAVWAGVIQSRRTIARVVVMVAMLALVGCDMAHLIGIAGGVKGGSFISRLVSIGYASIAAWIMAIVAIILLLRRREDAMYLATFAAGLMTLVGGVADLGILSKTSVVFLWSPSMARVLVALTLGFGIGIVVAGVLLTRPAKPSQPDPQNDLTLAV